MFTVRKALAATAIGALTIVPLAACSSEEASDTVDAATSSAAEAVESEPEPAAEVDHPPPCTCGNLRLQRWAVPAKVVC